MWSTLPLTPYHQPNQPLSATPTTSAPPITINHTHYYQPHFHTITLLLYWVAAWGAKIASFTPGRENWSQGFTETATAHSIWLNFSETNTGGEITSACFFGVNFTRGTLHIQAREPLTSTYPMLVSWTVPPIHTPQQYSFCSSMRVLESNYTPGRETTMLHTWYRGMLLYEN